MAGNVKPIVWMRAVRDAGPTVGRLAVLLCLALRMRQDGAGYTSTRQLANDAKVSHRTVERATQWAREGLYLDRMRRGHRLGNGLTAATEWRLIQPSQPDTRDTLSDSQPVTGVGYSESQPDRTPSQPDTGKAPEVYPPEIRGQGHTSPQGRARVDADGMALNGEVEAAYTAAGGRECVICGRPWPTATNPPDDRLCAACRAVSEADTVPRDPAHVARPDPLDVDLDTLFEGVPDHDRHPAHRPTPDRP